MVLFYEHIMKKIDLSYLPQATEGHQTPTDSVLDMWKKVHNQVDFKHLVEIGLNAGHSSAIVMSLIGCRVTAIDISKHLYTIDGVRALEGKFGKKFSFIKGTTQSCGDVKGDLLHIDGDHSASWVEKDLTFAVKNNFNWVLLDDWNLASVREGFNRWTLANGAKWYNTVELFNYKTGSAKVQAMLCKLTY